MYAIKIEFDYIEIFLKAINSNSKKVDLLHCNCMPIFFPYRYREKSDIMSLINVYKLALIMFYILNFAMQKVPKPNGLLMKFFPGKIPSSHHQYAFIVLLGMFVFQ